MTGTGNIVGTADYMSPEQVKGAKVDGRSDLFSVGCMLFELAAGRRPFHSDNLMAIFYKITHEEANFDLIPQGAEYDALMPILKKALAKNIDERYQTAYEFAVDLREWLKAHATTRLVAERARGARGPRGAHPRADADDRGAGHDARGRRDGRARTVDRRPARRRARGRWRRRAPAGAPCVEAGRRRDDAARARRAWSRRRRCPRVPRASQPQPKPSVLPWVAMGLALVAVGVAGWLAWKSQQAPPAPVAQAPPPPRPRRRRPRSRRPRRRP